MDKMNKKAFLQDFKKNKPNTKPQFLHTKVKSNVNENEYGSVLQAFYNHAKEEWAYSILSDVDGTVFTKYESELEKLI